MELTVQNLVSKRSVIMPGPPSKLETRVQILIMSTLGGSEPSLARLESKTFRDPTNLKAYPSVYKHKAKYTAHFE